MYNMVYIFFFISASSIQNSESEKNAYVYFGKDYMFPVLFRRLHCHSLSVLCCDAQVFCPLWVGLTC
jgi:hypothetical protein